MVRGALGGGINVAGIMRREAEQAKKENEGENKEETSECPTAESHRR